MREIKFRGKCIPEFPHPVAKWVYGSFVSDKLILSPYKERNENRHFWYMVDPDTVGQYTGLKDSNGKEIYEGDIIASQSDLIPIFELKSPDYVVFHDGAFWLSDSWNRHNCKGTLLAIASVHNEIARCKVIGNIYDNPELLEVEA